MQNGMFNTAHIEINRQPIFHVFLIKWLVGKMWVWITEKIPARSCPLRHSICFSFCRGAAGWAAGVDPPFNSCKWRLCSSGWFVFFDFWQKNGELVFWDGNNSTFWTMNEGYWFSPIALS